MEAYLLIFLTVLVGHVKSNTCYTDNFAESIYCSYDCCGHSGNQYCCFTDSDNTIFTGAIKYGVGTIVGIVLGTLAGLGILITVIACCCCHQCRRQTSGQVIQPHVNPGISMVTTTAQPNGMQMQMNQMPPGIYANPNSATQPMVNQMPPGIYANPYSATQPMTVGYVPYMPNNPSIGNLNATPPPEYEHDERK